MKNLKVGAGPTSLLSLASLSLLLACGHSAGTAVPPPTTGKGYHATAPAAAAPTPAPARAAAPVVAQPAPAATPPPPPTANTQPVTLSSPQRPYEPPLPLEPGRSSSVYEPTPPANNGPNTTAKGQRFSVQGVDPSDVLNIRSGPSAGHEIVGTIPPDGSGVIPLGGRRQIGPSVWREVSYRGVRGWVNDRFLVEERVNRAR